MASVTDSLLTLNIADVVTLLVTALAGFQVWWGRPSRIVRRNRHRHLGRLRQLRPGWEPSSVRTGDVVPFSLPELGGRLSRRTIARRVKVIINGVQVDAADELSWLADAMQLPRGEALVFLASDDVLERLIAGYAGYASRIERGVLFGATGAPLVQREVALCHDVVRIMRSAQVRQRFKRHSGDLVIGHRSATFTLRGLEAPNAEGQADFRARDLAVSYRRHRIVLHETPVLDPAGTLQIDRLQGVSPEEYRRIATDLEGSNYFDGTIPRLTNWCMERDTSSGHHTVHLAIAECSYFSLVVDHYRWRLSDGDKLRKVDGTRVNLLTLAAVLLTSCGHLVFIRKASNAGSYASRFGPTITGNLEFWPRHGITPDKSPDGMPDLLRALAREGREELGLVIEPGTLVTTGLATITVPEEAGSNVLLTCGTVDLTLEELRRRARHADPVEGAWEVGGSLLALRMPVDETELNAAIDWLVGTTELNAHGTLTGLGALAIFGNQGDVYARACRSVGRTQVVPRPAGVTQMSLIERPMDPFLPDADAQEAAAP